MKTYEIHASYYKDGAYMFQVATIVVGSDEEAIRIGKLYFGQYKRVIVIDALADLRGAPPLWDSKDVKFLTPDDSAFSLVGEVGKA